MRGGFRRLAGGLLAGILGRVAALWLCAGRWRQRAEARLQSRGTVASTPQGPIEYGTAGDGVPVLVFHATPGGYDQGLALASFLDGGRLHVIAPSRAGYLRTPRTTGRSPEEQATATAALLDTLAIPRVAVVGVSSGGPAAVAFALGHAERCSRLVLWQAVIRRNPMDTETVTRLTKGFMVTTIGAWLTLGTVKVVPWLALPKGIKRDVETRRHFGALIATFFPLDLRRDGVLNDARNNAELPDYPLHEITVPTLIVHGTEDTTVRYTRAETAAKTIPDARLVEIPHGTHETTFVARDALTAIATVLSSEHDQRNRR